MEQFTPYSALFGGLLIGLASIGLLYSRGKICGISGIYAAMWENRDPDSLWRFQFILGLIVGGLIMGYFKEGSFDSELAASFPMLLLGGFLVGFGSRLGSGCTSGHGVCGVGRMQKRSITATLIFVACGMATATLFRQVIEGGG